jgi:hypothetical protein
MHQAFALHALANAEFRQQIDRVLFENPGAYTLLHIFAGTRFKNYALDTFAVQKLREDETGGTGSDDTDLRSHHHSFLYQRSIGFLEFANLIGINVG